MLFYGSVSQDVENWYLLAEDRFAEFLRRAGQGESPDLLMAEAWANSHECPGEHEEVCGDVDMHAGITTFSLVPGE